MSIPLDDTVQLKLVLELLSKFIKDNEEIKTKINQLEVKVDNIKVGGGSNISNPPSPPPLPSTNGGGGGSILPDMSDVINEIRNVLKNTPLTKPPFEVVLDTNIIYTLNSSGINPWDISVKYKNNSFDVELWCKSTLLDTFEWKPYRYDHNASTMEDNPFYNKLEIWQKKMVKGMEVDKLLREIVNGQNEQLVPHKTEQCGITAIV